ncbi:MAG: hypothetical protein MN733_20835 [Nitrososphaera sp.]|nr:hypothetical protein [Nitrososphaera sp.]
MTKQSGEQFTLEQRAQDLTAIRLEVTNRLTSNKYWSSKKGCGPRGDFRQKSILITAGYVGREAEYHLIIVSAWGCRAYPGDEVAVEIYYGQVPTKIINHLGQVIGPIAYFEHVCKLGDQYRTENIQWLVEKIMHFFPLVGFTINETIPPRPRKAQTEAEIDLENWIKLDSDGNETKWDAEGQSVVLDADGHWIVFDTKNVLR